MDILAPPAFLQSVTYDQVGSDFQQNYDLEVGQYMFKSDILDHNSLPFGPLNPSNTLTQKETK